MSGGSGRRHRDLPHAESRTDHPEDRHHRSANSLNPLVGLASSTWEVLGLNYDALVGLDPTTMAPQKGESSEGLATDWTVSPDGKSWTFTMRRNALWQDTHQPVTANDVAFTYNLVAKTQPATYAGMLEGVKSATAVDDFTVRIECEQPAAGLLYNLPYVLILPQHVWAGVPAKTISTSYSNDPPVVGSGPFQIVTWKRDAYVELAANKSYWRGTPHVDRILFEYFTSGDAMMQDFKRNTLDAAEGLLPAQMKGLQHISGITAEPVAINGYDDLVFNSYEPPPGGSSSGNPVLRDWRFRRAQSSGQSTARSSSLLRTAV